MKTAAKTFRVQREYRLLSFVLGTGLGRHQISYLGRGHLNTFKCIALYKFELLKLWNNTFQRFIRFKYAKMQKLWNLQNIHHFGFMCGHTHITFYFCLFLKLRMTKSMLLCTIRQTLNIFVSLASTRNSLTFNNFRLKQNLQLMGCFASQSEYLIQTMDGGNILLSMAQKVSWQKCHCTLGCSDNYGLHQSDCHLPLGNEAH